MDQIVEWSLAFAAGFLFKPACDTVRILAHSLASKYVPIDWRYKPNPSTQDYTKSEAKPTPEPVLIPVEVKIGNQTASFWEPIVGEGEPFVATHYVAPDTHRYYDREARAMLSVDIPADSYLILKEELAPEFVDGDRTIQIVAGPHFREHFRVAKAGQVVSGEPTKIRSVPAVHRRTDVSKLSEAEQAELAQDYEVIEPRSEA